jgi:hypothetical protein
VPLVWRNHDRPCQPGHVVRPHEVPIIDLLARNELIDVYGPGGFQSDVVEFVFAHLKVLSVDDVLARDFLAGVCVDLLILDPVPGFFIDLIATDFLGLRSRAARSGMSRAKGAKNLSSWRAVPCTQLHIPGDSNIGPPAAMESASSSIPGRYHWCEPVRLYRSAGNGVSATFGAQDPTQYYQVGNNKSPTPPSAAALVSLEKVWFGEGNDDSRLRWPPLLGISSEIKPS